MNVRLAIYAGVAFLLVVSWGGAYVLYQAAGVGSNVAPLSPREFDRFTVVAVGTGGAYENPSRRGASLALGLGSQLWLIDAGRGVAAGLRAAAIPVEQPTTVFLTSLSAENCLGLDDLIFTGWLAPRVQPLRLVGPPGTKDFANDLMAAYETARQAGVRGLGLPEEGAEIEVLEATDGFSLDEGGVLATARSLVAAAPSVSWRFEHEGRSVVVSATGASPEALVEAAAGADWWLHEAVYVPSPEEAEAAGVLTDPARLEREAALHTSILDVGELASRAGVGGLGLLRLRPPPLFGLQVTSLVSDTFDGDIWVPADADELEP